MAATMAAAAVASSGPTMATVMAAAPFHFRRRNLILSSSSSFSPRSAVLQPRVARLSMRSVSKDIKYADNQPIVPWGPRYSRSTVKDLRINIAISGALTMGHADWKPLQFLCFAYFYQILEKLKATEPAITPIYNEYGEVEGQGIHMAKRVLCSLGLVLGSILAASLGYSGLANFSQFLGHYIPSVVYNFQELIVTTASSVLLCILASYYP